MQQNDKSAEKLQYRKEKILGTVVGKLGNVEKVADHPRHNGAGLMAVKIGHRQTLQMIEQIPSHIRLHTHARKMPVIGDKIVQRIFEKINTEKQSAQQQKQPQRLRRSRPDAVIQHLPR